MTDNYNMGAPKFIITSDGHLRLGMVNLHADLLQPGDHCIGGGYYSFDYASNRMLLDRKSYDYGRPQWNLLDTLRLPAGYKGFSPVYVYDDGEELNLDEIMKVVYE